LPFNAQDSALGMIFPQSSVTRITVQRVQPLELVAICG